MLKELTMIFTKNKLNHRSKKKKLLQVYKFLVIN